MRIPQGWRVLERNNYWRIWRKGGVGGDCYTITHYCLRKDNPQRWELEWNTEGGDHIAEFATSLKELLAWWVGQRLEGKRPLSPFL